VSIAYNQIEKISKPIVQAIQELETVYVAVVYISCSGNYRSLFLAFFYILKCGTSICVLHHSVTSWVVELANSHVATLYHSRKSLQIWTPHILGCMHFCKCYKRYGFAL